MNISSIRTKKEYQNALLRPEIIFDAKPGTKDGDELEIHSILLEKYENDHDPIDMPGTEK
jgi:HTH-type transcriptional regulator / antitoxin HigA